MYNVIGSYTQDKRFNNYILTRKSNIEGSTTPNDSIYCLTFFFWFWYRAKYIVP